MHHAKRGEASGFCYVNDIVLDRATRHTWRMPTPCSVHTSH